MTKKCRWFSLPVIYGRLIELSSRQTNRLSAPVVIGYPWNFSHYCSIPMCSEPFLQCCSIAAAVHPILTLMGNPRETTVISPLLHPWKTLPSTSESLISIVLDALVHRTFISVLTWAMTIVWLMCRSYFSLQPTRGVWEKDNTDSVSTSSQRLMGKGHKQTHSVSTAIFSTWTWVSRFPP